jgi:hypothetical protein
MPHAAISPSLAVFLLASLPLAVTPGPGFIALRWVVACSDSRSSR